MKKILLFLVVSVFSFTAFSEALPSRVRIDIDGRKNHIKFDDVNTSGNLKNQRIKWLKETQQGEYLSIESGDLTDQWQKMEFSFIPDKSGAVRLLVRGNWTKKDPVRFVAYDNFTFSGFKSLNPDFEVTKNNTISGWALRDFNMCIAQSNAASGKNYVKCTHDFYIYQNMHVTAGKKATLTFYARSAESAPRPANTPVKYERMK